VTDLTEAGHRAAEIAADARDDYAAMTIPELEELAAAARSAVLTSGAILADRCGDPVEARRQLALALELPASVMRRAAASASLSIDAGHIPSVADLAAHTALLIRNVELMDLRIEQRDAGPVN
jgi:hypothetical protein